MRPPQLHLQCRVLSKCHPISIDDDIVGVDDARFPMAIMKAPLKNMRMLRQLVPFRLQSTRTCYCGELANEYRVDIAFPLPSLTYGLSNLLSVGLKEIIDRETTRYSNKIRGQIDSQATTGNI